MGDQRNPLDVVTEMWAPELREVLEAAVAGEARWRSDARRVLANIHDLRTPKTATLGGVKDDDDPPPLAA